MSYTPVPLKFTPRKDGSPRKTRLGKGNYLKISLAIPISEDIKSFLIEKATELGMKQTDYLRSLIFKEMISTNYKLPSGFEGVE